MAQSKFTLSGYIYDAASNEKIIGATVYVQEVQAAATTNAYGFYTITLPAGTYKLFVTYTGYASQEIEIVLNKNTAKDFSLATSTKKSLTELKVSAKKKQPIQQTTQTSMNSIPMAQIKALPAIFGEVDVLKALQLLPGVSGGSEGSAGIYVRGGGPDQNLFLLDGVPVYNVNHLGGFFSTFNADAISNVDLYKGGFPARFGGRLSSVVDIRLKEGNNKKFNVEAGIGAISSRLLVEGPLKKNKGSFMISGRRTYVDQLLKPIIKAQSDGTVSAGYYFYDLNAKLNYKISRKDHVYLSGYFGRDKFYANINESGNTGGTTSFLRSDNGLDWGNATGVARWNHLFSNKLFSNLSVSYTSYDYQVGSSILNVDGTDSFSFSGNLFSGIRDLAAKYDLEYTPNIHHTVRGGASFTRHRFTPQSTNIKFKTGGSSIDTSLNNQRIFANETDVYAEDDWKINDALRVNIGLHFSNFDVQNSNYSSWQPRVSMRYLLNPNYSIKASYAQMNQFINLLTFDGVGLPTDYWVPVTDKLKPQVSRQVALGVAGTINKTYEASIEGYYKTMRNIIDYKDGSSYFGIGGNTSFEDIVEMGQGLCYGSEFLLQKKEGKLQGLVGYGLAWTKRKYPTINFGEWYFYKYDRRHDFKIAAVYQLSDRVEISGDWVYNTGNWVTLPTQKIPSTTPSTVSEAIDYLSVVDYYPNRNNWNVRDYHRMDIAFKFSRQRKYYHRSWNIGCYNLYGRKNTFFINPGIDNAGNNIFNSISLFGFPLPYVALNVKITSPKKDEK
jgi:outer membrane receptor for ferrienterochelin and colicin